MKKITILILWLSIASSYAQKTKFSIYSNLGKNFQLYIDGQLQSYEAASFYNAFNIPTTAKEISVIVVGHSHITRPKIAIEHGQKNLIYELSYNNLGEYDIKKVDQASVSNVYKALAAFIPKKKPVKLDSNYKFVHSCKVADTNLDKIVSLYNELKHPKAKEKLLNDKFKYSCLLVDQLKKLSFYMNGDQDRFQFFQLQFNSCYDRNEYMKLIESLSTSAYQTKFELWLKGMNYN